MPIDLSDAEATWIQNARDKSAEAFFDEFSIEDKQRGHLRYAQLLQSKYLSDDLRKQLLDQFGVWKIDKAHQFWLHRRARVTAIKTAATLVEGSAPYAEGAILHNAATETAQLKMWNKKSKQHTPPVINNEQPATESSEKANAGAEDNDAFDDTESVATVSYPCALGQPSTSTSNTSSLTEPSAKKKRTHYLTEEPWHSLMVSLIKIVNGSDDVSFPEAPANMCHMHRILYEHAVSLLDEYQQQSNSERDITLVKDAQVVMSCLLNTMSPRIVQHCITVNDEEIISKAVSHATIPGFDEHPCLEFLKKYQHVLEEHDVAFLERRLTKDRGLLLAQYPDDEELPKTAVMQNKVLKLLIRLCDFIKSPPFGTGQPSENDCLQIWSYLFDVIKERISIYSGEKMMDASKVLRQQQASEFGDVSDTGRRVDLLFMYQGIELSNIEFKRPDISRREVTMQSRKNVRLGRCLQEAHVTYGVKDASVIMGDITGFAGVIYQIRPMEDISIAGKTTSSVVSLPSSVGELEDFLTGSSLAIIWNFIEFLENQGPRVVRAKERAEGRIRMARIAEAVKSPKESTPSLRTKKYINNVTFSPTKKRNLNF